MTRLKILHHHNTVLKIDFAMETTDPTVVELNVGIRAAANDQWQIVQDAVPDLGGLMVDCENDFHPKEIAIETGEPKGRDWLVRLTSVGTKNVAELIQSAIQCPMSIAQMRVTQE